MFNSLSFYYFGEKLSTNIRTETDNSIIETELQRKTREDTSFKVTNLLTIGLILYNYYWNFIHDKESLWFISII